MKLQIRIAVTAGALALCASPAALAMGKPEGVPGHGKGAAHGHETGGPSYTPSEPVPGPKAGLPAKAKAYGRYCKGESKEHVKGEKGTAFSRCVTNMAQAASHGGMAPGRVCKGESKEHVKGEKGTAFSRCVKAVGELRRKEHEEGSA
ncbi:MAG TPA: hypothetical protein VIC28_03675 [Thermoanaerobaculia bacterium]